MELKAVLRVTTTKGLPSYSRPCRSPSLMGRWSSPFWTFLSRQMLWALDQISPITCRYLC